MLTALPCPTFVYPRPHRCIVAHGESGPCSVSRCSKPVAIVFVTPRMASRLGVENAVGHSRSCLRRPHDVVKAGNMRHRPGPTLWASVSWRAFGRILFSVGLWVTMHDDDSR